MYFLFNVLIVLTTLVFSEMFKRRKAVLFFTAMVWLSMGIGYELIKLAGRKDNWLTRIISAPGIALQHLTVFEPEDDMIECAIAAMEKVIPEDGSDNF